MFGLTRLYWRLVGTGYTCDDCGRWTPRGRGRAHVSTEDREHAAVPSLPCEPVVILEDDPRLARIAREIGSGLIATRRRTILRCPSCADAWAMRRIEAAARKVARDVGAIVALAERTVANAAA